MQGERWPKWPELRQPPPWVPSGHLRSGAGLSEPGVAIRASLRVTSVTQCRILSSKAGKRAGEGVSELDISKEVQGEKVDQVLTARDAGPGLCKLLHLHPQMQSKMQYMAYVAKQYT